MNTPHPTFELTSPQTEALTTFLANLYKAANDRETVHIGGGEFNHNELRTVYGAVLTLIAKAK